MSPPDRFDPHGRPRLARPRAHPQPDAVDAADHPGDLHRPPVPLRRLRARRRHRRAGGQLADARSFEDLPGPPSDGGRSALWARIPEVLDMSAATLAILGDYVPFGIGQALGAMAGGNSLDNTLRVGRLVPTKWVLLDIRVDLIANGFGHGVVHLWAQDGTLLATASQSTIVRYWKDE